MSGMVRLCLLNDTVEENAKPARAWNAAKNARKINDPKDSVLHERSLQFNVVFYSGQDENYPACELTRGMLGRGWQSPRFCIFPQELVLQLQSPSHILTMQLLCHEYKIASKVEIFVSLTSPWVHSQEAINQMKHLGYLSLDPNHRTEYQARELKSIQVNSPASAVRLVLHNCYANQFNVYNQVGIVALIITGEPLEKQPPKQHVSSTTTPQQPRIQVDRTNVGNLSLTNVDSLTAHQIQQLQQQKAIAVEEEDYDEAKRLKILIQNLKVLGEHIKELELQKRAAVEEEDYDVAKWCKLEIERLRQSIMEPKETSSINGPSTRGETSFQAGATMKKFNLVTSTNEANCTISREDSCTQTSQSLAFKPNDLKRCLEASVDSNSFAQNFNFTAEEPARMKGNYEVDLENLKQDTMIKQQSFAMAFEAPAHLSEAQVKELGPVLLVIDQYHMECLLSRQWLLRDKALHFLESNLQSNDVDDDLTSTFRAAHKILIQALNDKVSTVFHTSLQVLRVCMEKYAAHVPSKEIHTSACEMVSILLEKLGDSNVRTKKAAAETLLFLASKKEIGLQVISPLILKSPKNQAIWKPVLGRLQFLLMAVPNFKLQPQNQLGFSLDSLMAFVVLCFSSPSGEVRNAAMKVTNEVYKLLGPPVEKYLKGVKPVIYEALVNSFEKAGSAAPKDRASSSIDKSSQDSDHPLECAKTTKSHVALQHESSQMLQSCSKVDEAATEDGSQQSLVVNQKPHDSGRKKDHSSAVSCSFCGIVDLQFSDDNKLDLHFSQKCPMLVNCSNCKQIVEISCLQVHLISDCLPGKRYMECQKCLQAVPESKMGTHTKSKECRLVKGQKMNHCPLCRNSVQPGDLGWRAHLLGPPGCAKNSRTKPYS